MSLFRSPLVRLLTALSLLMLGAMAPESARPEQETSKSPGRLEAALTLWLQDNDEDALPQLAEMARAGNSEARQFLRLLHLRPDLWTPWLAALSEEERRTFFKPKLPGGPKYGGWWRRGEEPEIISLLRSKPLEVPFVADMTRLIELGEPRLAFVRLAPALKHKPLGETRALGESPALPAQLSFLSDLASFLKQGVLTDDDLPALAPDLSDEARMQMALHYSWAMFLMVEGDFGHEITVATMRDVITHLFRIAEGLPYTAADIAWPTLRLRGNPPGPDAATKPLPG